VALGVRGALTTAFNNAVALGPPGFTAAANFASQITALGAFAGLNNPALPGFVPAFNFSAQPPFNLSGFHNLAFATSGGLINGTLNGVGLEDSYRQSSSNWALFTHNIFDITDTLSLTVGARYTHEKKNLDAELTDNNILCSALSGGGLQQLPCVIPAVFSLTGQDP
jgi:hypothetical protein